MYQACWWNEHPMYQAVMIRHNEEDIYVHNFVMYSHLAAGNAIGRIETLYVNVSVNSPTQHLVTYVVIKTVLLCCFRG